MAIWLTAPLRLQKRQPPPKLRNLQRKLKKGVDYRLLHAATNRVSVDCSPCLSQ